jgi:hypothetical protein
MALLSQLASLTELHAVLVQAIPMGLLGQVRLSGKMSKNKY